MEISDVLVALEELKDSMAAVNSANANVQRAANAAQMVCEAFSICASRIDGFPEEVMTPIRNKVAEISEASAQMVHGFSTSVEDLRAEAKEIAVSFDAAIANACERIRADIAEFHREVESLDAKIVRVTNRVDEKTDGIVVEVQRQVANTRDGIRQMESVQGKVFDKMNVALESAVRQVADCAKEAANNVVVEIQNQMSSVCDGIRQVGSEQGKVTTELNVAIENAKDLLKGDITVAADGICRVAAHEVEKVVERVDGTKTELLSEVRSARSAAIISAKIAFVAAVCAVLLAVKLVCDM